MTPTTRLQMQIVSRNHIHRPTMSLKLTGFLCIRCDNRQPLRPAAELAKRRSRREVIEEGWIGKNHEWFVKTRAALFSIRHLFSARTVFSVLRFLMRLLRRFKNFGIL